MELAGILFDFDGLVLDTETSEFVTVAGIFEDHGLTLTEAEWVGYIGRADHPHWTDLLADALGEPLPDLDRVVEARRERHAEHIAALEPNPGVVELADAARAANLGVAIASSSPLGWVTGHLDRLGIRDRFTQFATRDDVGRDRAKPHPDLFLLAAERLGLDPTRCVVLEDSEPGVRAGNDAGCATVAVPAGLTANLPFAEADLVVASVADLDIGRLDSLVTAKRLAA